MSRYKEFWYSSWRSMISRCTNPNSANYKYYGGAGVFTTKRAIVEWTIATIPNILTIAVVLFLIRIFSSRNILARDIKKGATKMCEAEFCYDEGQWLADRDQYERERKASGDSLVRSMQKRIESQREEIRRLHNHIKSLEQSRNAWRDKAERIGTQLFEVLNGRSEG